MRALVLEHEVTGRPGMVGEILRDRGLDLDELMIGERPFPWGDRPDLIVVMGSVKSVYDDADPLIREELEFMAGAIDEGVPILGICFGGQALATVLGGRVEKSPHPEVGWHGIQSDDPDLIPEGPWFQWHYDRITLPPGATEVARNAAAVQAFVLGPHLGLQFHPEVDLEITRSWVAIPEDLAAAGVADGAALVRESEQRWPEARRMAEQLVDTYLTRIGVRVG